ncbi:Coproporphyrinogen III oxidase, anaerobic [Enterobacter sp. FY-07]|nr:Coproporphyrinogen III oxidase, anaerobic [Enterobacter sp. FY-07]
MPDQTNSVSTTSTSGALAIIPASAAARMVKSRSPMAASCAPPKRAIRVAICRGHHLESQLDVEQVDKPFEFFMNRFRLPEAAPCG